jgi:hypothetical protein
MTKMFHYVNEELFDNLLDIPTFKVLTEKDMQVMAEGWNLPRFEGVCIPSHAEGDTHYFIGIHEEMPENDFFNAFVHELIHVQCMESHSFSGHYGLFRMWTEKAIERFYGNFEEIA